MDYNFPTSLDWSTHQPNTFETVDDQNFAEAHALHDSIKEASVITLLLLDIECITMRFSRNYLFQQMPPHSVNSCSPNNLNNVFKVSNTVNTARQFQMFDRACLRGMSLISVLITNN
jgi:hypothetical protein